MDSTSMALILQFIKGNSKKKIILQILKANLKIQHVHLLHCNSSKLHNDQTNSNMKLNIEIKEL